MYSHFLRTCIHNISDTRNKCIHEIDQKPKLIVNTGSFIITGRYWVHRYMSWMAKDYGTTCTSKLQTLKEHLLNHLLSGRDETCNDGCSRRDERLGGGGALSLPPLFLPPLTNKFTLYTLLDGSELSTTTTPAVGTTSMTSTLPASSPPPRATSRQASARASCPPSSSPSGTILTLIFSNNNERI